jgi:hypothetical protein
MDLPLRRVEMADVIDPAFPHWRRETLECGHVLEPMPAEPLAAVRRCYYCFKEGAKGGD